MNTKHSLFLVEHYSWCGQKPNKRLATQGKPLHDQINAIFFGGWDDFTETSTHLVPWSMFTILYQTLQNNLILCFTLTTFCDNERFQWIFSHFPQTHMHAKGSSSKIKVNLWLVFHTTLPQQVSFMLYLVVNVCTTAFKISAGVKSCDVTKDPMTTNAIDLLSRFLEN